MAGKGIQINFLANVRDFLRGTSDVEEAFDDVANSLDDVARDGEKSNERLERSFRELADVSKRETSSAARGMKQDFASGTSAAKRDLAELGNEARQNAAETFSSFDGSAQSFADGIQGTLGGIVSSMGPLGAAAGAAGALGIGLVIAALETGEERSEAFREKVAELSSEFIESGEIGRSSLEFIIDTLKDLATETEQGKVNLTELYEAAQTAGRRLDVLARAYGSNSDELEKLIARERELQDEYQATANIALTQGQAASDAAEARVQAQRKIVEELEQTKRAVDEATAAEEAYAAAGGPDLERKAELIEAVNTAYDDAAGAVEVFVDEESGVFDVASYIESMQARSDALRDYQQTLAESALTPEAKSFLNSQGVESAAAFLAGYKSATPAQQAELNRIWSEAGREDSGTYAAELEKGMPDSIVGPKIEPQLPDAAAVVEGLQRQFTGRNVKVQAVLTERSGREIL